MGERSRLPKLRPGHKSLGVGYESNHDRNRDMSELRLVRADRNTSGRSSASEEADFSSIMTLHRLSGRRRSPFHAFPSCSFHQKPNKRCNAWMPQPNLNQDLINGQGNVVVLLNLRESVVAFARLAANVYAIVKVSETISGSMSEKILE